jgi:hypothetical protein
MKASNCFIHLEADVMKSGALTVNTHISRCVHQAYVVFVRVLQTDSLIHPKAAFGLCFLHCPSGLLPAGSRGAGGHATYLWRHLPSISEIRFRQVMSAVQQ